MPFDISAFAKTRTHLFHLTSRTNLIHIHARGSLVPTLGLITESQRTGLLRTRRPNHVDIPLGDGFVRLRDQQPLYERNCLLKGGWSFEDLVENLNSRVYFWPGTSDGPIPTGRRHFARYKKEDCVVLVVPVLAIFDSNPRLQPEFCRFNSGSPRWTGGRASPRGPATFVPADRFDGSPSEVIEVTFPAQVTLPWPRVAIESHTKWAV